MNKLNPRNKICFQIKEHIYINSPLKKFKTKKWNVLRKKIKYQRKNRIKTIKPEKRNQFYQKRLFEKQKLRNFYGCIPQYQLKNLYQKLKNKKNQINFFNKFIVALESRLDIILVRLKLARTMSHSKQLINHGKVIVNNQKVNKPNFCVKKGDIINRIIKKKRKKKVKND